MDQKEFPKTGQRLTFSTPHTDDMYNQENPAILADEDDLARDAVGFTNPYLHRRKRVNELQDGQKVYTVSEPFITGNAWEYVEYKTKYPIANILYVYISGSRIRKSPGGTEEDWVSCVRLVEDDSFRFIPNKEPPSGAALEIIYETTPLIDGEVTYRDYELAISGVHSYRTTKITLHTEEDEGDREDRVYENEIP